MRETTLTRKTRETDITLTLCIDGSGKTQINTGIGFFDHMLNSLCVHAGWNLSLTAKGDLGVDCHHTVEDVGILLGKALGEILGDKGGICRFGEATIPMDEALAQCAVDISGRPFLVFGALFSDSKVGEMDTQTVEEFFRAFAFNAGITLHLNLLYGNNDHHCVEVLFKVAAHALKRALQTTGGGVLSAKGVLV